MLYCKRVVDSVSDEQYYLLVNVHDDAQDPEHGASFDVEVTDGQTAWSQLGETAAMCPERLREVRSGWIAAFIFR